uniref:Uncharacterized protein n=1 Tax=Arundo donax TaxID=35708 RepID=A0A0A9AX01_ARUDO
MCQVELEIGGYHVAIHVGTKIARGHRLIFLRTGFVLGIVSLCML